MGQTVHHVVVAPLISFNIILTASPHLHNKMVEGTWQAGAASVGFKLS